MDISNSIDLLVGLRNSVDQLQFEILFGQYLCLMNNRCSIQKKMALAFSDEIKKIILCPTV